MSMTDPMSDLLTRIRNGHIAHHAEVTVPASNSKEQVVRILKEEGYISDYEVERETKNQGSIRVKLKYVDKGTPAISGLKRVSRPGRRLYRGKSEIPKVLNGLGITIISTNRGIMTGSACRDAGVGGEVLCMVW